jgi:hypothetical protein
MCGSPDGPAGNVAYAWLEVEIKQVYQSFILTQDI